MARTNFSPQKDRSTSQGGITSLRQSRWRKPLGVNYNLPKFNPELPRELPRNVTGRFNFTPEEVRERL